MSSNYFLKHTISQAGREKPAEHTLHLLNTLLLRQLEHGESSRTYMFRNTVGECIRGLSPPPKLHARSRCGMDQVLQGTKWESGDIKD